MSDSMILFIIAKRNFSCENIGGVCWCMPHIGENVFVSAASCFVQSKKKKESMKMYWKSCEATNE